MHTVVRHLTIAVRYFIPSLEKGRVNNLLPYARKGSPEDYSILPERKRGKSVDQANGSRAIYRQ